MEVRILGTGASEGVPAYGCRCPSCEEARRTGLWRRQTSLLVSHGGEHLLVDAGFDVVPEIDGVGILAVILTHWHSDHYAGLFRLRWSRVEIPLFSPPGAPPEIAGKPVSLRMRGVAPFSELRIGPFGVTPYPLRHTAPTLGYLVEAGGRSLAVLFDTKGLPGETLRFLSGRRVDLAVVDATYAPGVQREDHNDVDGAIEVGRAVGASRVVLTHVAHHNLPHSELDRYARERGAEAAYDGMTLEV
ncbi:MAG: MBL fold metallo-hydrolase [Thermoproteota archaeon]|mgnify:CR=1 FL=1|nr:MAG: MBL fold metallo-hydrolase [Candidatus Korarchaeota archaeon]